jgi:tRNA/rRNA methyltransferase
MKSLLDNATIVLVGTLAPGNIGSAARAMKNMGLSNLILVNPQCQLTEEALRMATNAQDILKSAKQVLNMRDAVAMSGYIFGTTARSRKWRSAISPEAMGKKIVSFLQNNRVSIIFGPEDRGLSNEDLEICHEIVSIPMAKCAGSINLSHAVMIVCYEIHCALRGKAKDKRTKLASADEVEKMYDHMRDALLEIGFLNRQNPEHTLGSFRRILTRAGLKEQEVKLIRGVFRQLLWYLKKNR